MARYAKYLDVKRNFCARLVYDNGCVVPIQIKHFVLAWRIRVVKRRSGRDNQSGVADQNCILHVDHHKSKCQEPF